MNYVVRGRGQDASQGDLMPIEFDPPAIARHPNRSWTTFMTELLAAAGGWVSLPVSEVTGETKKAKQGLAHQAARIRGLRVQTTIQDGRLYSRLVPITVEKSK
jgi:hypothetical protein